MRRNLLVALALCAVVAAGFAGIASAAKITIRAGNLITTFGGNAIPKAIPKSKFAPVKTNIFGQIKTSDGTHPSALREVVVDFDKDAKVNVAGIPVCKPGQLEARDTKAAKKVCGKTVVGSGKATVEIKFPEQKPILVPSPLTVFNGGKSGGKTKLLIHVFITVPVPAAVVTQVTVTKKGAGLHSVAKVPVVAGGAGSALDFNFTIDKIGEAKCPDGKFNVSTPKILFKNEAGEPGAPAQTTMKGKLAVPCTPKG